MQRNQIRTFITSLLLFLLSFSQIDAQISGKFVVLTLQQNNLFDVFLSTVFLLFFDGIGIIPLGIISFLLLVIVLFCIWIRVKNRQMKALQKEVNNLTKKNNAKDKFFSIIGHDLKSPFNSLMGLSEMLVLHSETMNQSEVLNYSKMVHQSTGKLFALVENLLQWSRTQMGNTDYKPEKLDISIVTGNVVNLLRLSAQEKDIVIALKINPDLLAYADANIYSTVLRNLIGNAIKFSRVGSIIYVSGKKKLDNMIEIEIVDSGIGMNSDQVEKTFKIEEAYSTVGTFNERGTGLGLILSKEFVELNRGTIHINSKYGEGTTLKFTVPAADLHAN